MERKVVGGLPQNEKTIGHPGEKCVPPGVEKKIGGLHVTQREEGKVVEKGRRRGRPNRLIKRRVGGTMMRCGKEEATLVAREKVFYSIRRRGLLQ